MGPFAGVDVIAHVRRVTFGVERLIPHGRLDGWYPGEHLGYQLYLIRGPGMSLLTALIKAASLNRLPTVAALNAAVISSFVAFPLAAPRFHPWPPRSPRIDRVSVSV